jgi:circadian clock protein KaiC
VSQTHRVVETGVATIDQILGGGIPSRQSVVITGEPGSGKTVLASQIAFAYAAKGKSVVFATIASESQDKLLQELSGFSFYDADRIGNEIYMVSAYGALQRGSKDAKDLLLRTMRDRKADLLVIDGLRSLRDLWQNEAKLRDFLYEINVGVAQLGAIAIFTTEYRLEKLQEFPEATTVDGILALSSNRAGGRVVRRAQVVKLRGRCHLTGEHLMHITNDGVHVVPRIEEITAPRETFVPTSARAEFGLPELDKILHGGLPEKSTTLMAGNIGVGKTLLSLHFIATGVSKDEPGLLVSYSEPTERLVARAKAVGIDVTLLVATGKLCLDYCAPLNIEGDDLIDDILRRVRTLGAKRVVIDGLADLDASFVERDRVRPALISLVVELRRIGVTSIFIKEVPKLAGTDLDFSDTPLSVTAENLLFFRHIELRGRLIRIASVLKMRESGFDSHVREFEISENGIRVLEPLSAAEGLLTGNARALPSNGGTS